MTKHKPLMIEIAFTLTSMGLVIVHPPTAMSSSGFPCYQLQYTAGPFSVLRLPSILQALEKHPFTGKLQKYWNKWNGANIVRFWLLILVLQNATQKHGTSVSLIISKANIIISCIANNQNKKFLATFSINKIDAVPLLYLSFLHFK